MERKQPPDISDSSVEVRVEAEEERDLLYRFLEFFFTYFFRFFHSLEVSGELPADLDGSFIVAANHASYLDPLLLSLALKKKVTWLAWDRLFQIPVLSWFLRWGNVIPVNVDRGGRGSFLASLKVLKDGGIFGIFPEGALTLDGRLKEAKTGMARISCKAGVPVVPVTIYGSFRVFPKGGFPKPGKIKVMIHKPIYPDPERVGEKIYYQKLTEEVMSRIESGHQPQWRFEKRKDTLISRQAPPVRIYESIPLIAVLTGVWFIHTNRFQSGVSVQDNITLGLCLGGFYLLYLLLDIYFLPQSFRTRFVRNFFPVIFTLFALPYLEQITRTLSFSAGTQPIRSGLYFHVMNAIFYTLTLLYGTASLIFLYIKNYYSFQRGVRGLCLVVVLPYLLLLLPFSPVSAEPWHYLFQPLLPLSFYLFSVLFDYYYRLELFPVSLALLLVSVALSALLMSFSKVLLTLVSAIFIALSVFAYLHLFRFTAHDGRKV